MRAPRNTFMSLTSSTYWPSFNAEAPSPPYCSRTLLASTCTSRKSSASASSWTFRSPLRSTSKRRKSFCSNEKHRWRQNGSQKQKQKQKQNERLRGIIRTRASAAKLSSDCIASAAAATVASVKPRAQKLLSHRRAAARVTSVVSFLLPNFQWTRGRARWVTPGSLRQ